MYVLLLDGRILDSILYEVDNMIIITVNFITHFVNWYNNRLHLVIRLFFLD
jgi:hypothetical protein